MRRIIISVTNDLATDQRIKKISKSLAQMGFEIILIGRILSNSLPVTRNYRTIRMKLLFNKGFLFYAEYNIRLFFILISLKKDILLANDLDTLLPNFLISKIFSKKLVYDSHELFTEVPELIYRPRTQKVWLTIEKFVFPKLKTVITVNQSIASFYENKYQIKLKVIKNIAPRLKNSSIDTALSEQIKGNRKMIIIQGAGMNIDRGVEEAIVMMKYLENTILYIIGGGDIFEQLKSLVQKLSLNDRVIILNKMSYNQLMEYTKIADVGLSLDKGTNLNYEYSLPNKVFDYIQAQTPLLVSNRKEVAQLVLKNKIGVVSDSHDPKILAEQIKSIFNNPSQNKIWKENLSIAANQYCWENEEIKLKKIFSLI